MGTNLGMVDRVVRVVGGAAMIAVGLFLLRGLLGIVVGVLGALLIFSGTIGFCHVYKVLHIRTSRKA